MWACSETQQTRCAFEREASDVEALLPWLDWSYGNAKDALPKAA